LTVTFFFEIQKKKKLFSSTLSEDVDKEEVQTPEIDKNEIKILEKIGGL
jgi:hypothetical protein